MDRLATNDSELKAAIAAAKGGDTIYLANESKFGGVAVISKKYDAPLMFRPRDLLGPAPVVAYWIFRDVVNAWLDSIAVMNTTRYTSVELYGENLTVSNCLVNGGYLAKGNGNAPSYRSGINAGGKGIAISNNVITRVGTGIGIGGASGAVVSGNTIHETVQDCMNVASNVQDMAIYDNTFHGQIDAPKVGHHYDLLQFWVQTDATMDTRSVKVMNNRFIAPNDAITPQSIFGRADYGDNPFKFQDFEIAYNTIYSRQANAIRFSEGDNFNVHHNVLTFAGTDPWNSPTVNLPGILLQKMPNYQIHHNVMPAKPGYPLVDTPQFYKNVAYKLPV